MHPDLAQLVDLQRLDSAIAARRKDLADMPAREAALEARLAAATTDRDAARQRAADNKAARGAVEKDLGIVQSRLARFKDQTMAVKTNKEFHALQHEIATAQEEIRTLEDRILDLMVEADDLTGSAKAAERALAAADTAVAAGREQLASDRQRLEAELDDYRAQREAVADALPRHALTLYSAALKHGGVAVTVMHDGHCGVCHVRLRPQVALSVHANDSLVVCESCGRILYYDPPAAAAGHDAG